MAERKPLVIISGQMQELPAGDTLPLEAGNIPYQPEPPDNPSDGDLWVDSDEYAAAGMTNPMTTAGDIIIGGSTGTPTRLGIGTTGQVLTVVSGVPAWASNSLPTSLVTPKVTLGSSATSVEFTGLTFLDKTGYLLIMHLKANTGYGVVNAYFNNITTSDGSVYKSAWQEWTSNGGFGYKYLVSTPVVGYVESGTPFTSSTPIVHEVRFYRDEWGYMHWHGTWSFWRDNTFIQAAETRGSTRSTFTDVTVLTLNFSSGFAATSSFALHKIY